MCIATPMRVLSVHPGGHRARAIDRHGVEADIDLSLVEPVADGDWLLVFMGTARGLIDAHRAEQIDRALGALDAVLRGDAAAIDAAFPDLVGREPELPEHLRGGIH